MTTDRMILDALAAAPEGLTLRQLASIGAYPWDVRMAIRDLLIDGRVCRLPLGPKPPPGADETWLYFTPPVTPGGWHARAGP